MILKDLSFAKRKEAISYTLAPILKRLKSPIDTRTLVVEVADALETREYKAITLMLFKLAPVLGADRVRQVGEPFRRFGREMRRWEWGPKELDSADPGRVGPVLRSFSEVGSTEGLEDLL